MNVVFLNRLAPMRGIFYHQLSRSEKVMLNFRAGEED